MTTKAVIQEQLNKSQEQLEEATSQNRQLVSLLEKSEEQLSRLREADVDTRVNLNDMVQFYKNIVEKMSAEQTEQHPPH